MRLGDFDALKKEIMECMTSWDEHSDYGQGRLRSYEWTIHLIDNASTVVVDCENCPFKKFSEDMADKLAKAMIDNGITDFDEFAKQF